MNSLHMVLLTLVIGSLVPFDLRAQQVVRESAYQLSLPAGWERTMKLPPGTDAGFRKKLSKGEYATFFIRHQVMPSMAGAPPSDTSDMKRQWDSALLNQFPDMRPLNGESPKVNGIILINGDYELTDGGIKLHRRYTYFFSGRTAFVVQCSAPPSLWTEALGDFNELLLSLNPAGSDSPKAVASDDLAITELQGNVRTLLSTFPVRWMCSLTGASFTSVAPAKGRALVLGISFDRKDIADIYRATAHLFAMIKAGDPDLNLEKVPVELRSAASNSAEFIKYVGQIWGLASNHVADCSPAVGRYLVLIFDSKGQEVGSIGISREDAAMILSGKLSVADAAKLARMYVFE